MVRVKRSAGLHGPVAGRSRLPGAFEHQEQGPARTTPGVFRTRPLPVSSGRERPVLPGNHL